MKKSSPLWFSLQAAFLVLFAGCEQRKDAAVNAMLGHEDRICSIDFSVDGSKLVSGSADSTIRIWDVRTRKCLHVLDLPKDWVHCVDVSPDGVHFVSCGRDEKVRIWDIESGELRKELEGHKGIIFSVKYVANGNRLISYAQDKTLKIWEVASGVCEKTITISTFWTPSDFSLIPDTSLVVLAGDYPDIWDLDEGRSIQSFEGHQDSIGTIAVSYDGNHIASGGNYQDHSLRYWDRHTAECLWMKEFAADHGVEAILFSPSDQVLVSGHFSGVISGWKTSTGEQLRTVQAHACVDALSLSSDMVVASAGRDVSDPSLPPNINAIKLWKLTTLKPATAPTRNNTLNSATEQ